VTVHDDGLGFDEEQPTPGQGLRNIRARASAIGGGFRLVTSPGGGTALEVVLRHTVPSVRPDDVLTGLRQVGGLDAPGTPLVTRLEQGPFDAGSGTIGDPLST